MSIFSKILSSLGIGDNHKTGASSVPPTTPTSTGTTQTVSPSSIPPVTGSSNNPAAGFTSSTNPLTTVDVVAKLESLAASNPEKLNWKTSIVDLLKLLGLDSSLQARKDLAVELGVPSEKLNDSVQLNTWLHKKVLEKLAENGGNIPPELHR